MGRAERRRAERNKRIEDRKDKILVTQKELRDLKRDTIRNTSNFDTEALMTCFALANRRLYKHGLERSLRTLQYVDELMGPILDGSKTVDDYRKELFDEIGLSISCSTK